MLFYEYFYIFYYNDDFIILQKISGNYEKLKKDPNQILLKEIIMLSQFCILYIFFSLFKF